MKIVSIQAFKHSHCGKPPVFKGKRELFKRNDEPMRIDFKKMLEDLKEIVNPTPC